MSQDLKKQLIKLGTSNPALRPHIKPILASIQKEARNMNTLDILKEYALIVRGDHPKWGGDRILNGETFAKRIQRDQAKSLSKDIRSNLDFYSLETGLPPSSLLRFISYL